MRCWHRPRRPSRPPRTPAQRRQRTLDALVDQVDKLARDEPVLLVFEDAHWADPSSLEWLGRVLERMADLRLLVVVTFRPEFAPSWSGQAGVTTLALDRLSKSDANAMIDRLAEGRVLPPKVRSDIIERADGIPLFVQEMTRAVLDADDGSSREAVPATLQASLLSRLDRLGEAKEVAQLGAAIGREFSHDLLVCVAAKPAAELARSLDRLVAAGLLFRQQPPPHATYLFNHALVQDAAYGTLLREARRTIHARIVDAFESRFADIVSNQPELVARHCTEAGQIEKAASLWGRAGRRSFARSALWEAADQLSRALAQIASLPGSPTLRREQIQLQLDLSNALIHTKGHASPETKASFDRARSLIEQAAALGEAPDDPLVAYSVLYGFWVANRMAFNGPVALELAAQFQALAEGRGRDRTADARPSAGRHIARRHRRPGHRQDPSSTRRSRCTIQSSIARWQRDSATTSGCPRWLGGPMPHGGWAISTRRSPKGRARWRVRVRSAMRRR